MTDIRREHNSLHGDEQTLFKKAGYIYIYIFFLPFISEKVCNTVSDTDITPGYRTDPFMLTPELIFGEDFEKEGGGGGGGGGRHTHTPKTKTNKKY